jgi:nitroreductase
MNTFTKFSETERPGIEVRIGLFEAIAGRRSVRDYTSDPVSREVFGKLVDAAVLAPSAINEQPWHFTIVTNRTLLDAVAAKAKARMLKAAAGLPDHFRQTLSDPKFHIFYHAPALIVISAPAAAQWAMEDCALAAENLMLAAYALGLGSCWIGFAQRWLDTKEGRAAIGLSRDERAVAPIIVGHPKSAVGAVARRKPTVDWKE